MPLGDAGRDLLEGVVRILGVDAGGHHAARGHQLDQVGSGVDLFAHRLDHLVRPVGDPAIAVAVPAGHADHLARGADGRTELAAVVAGIAHCELKIVLAAAVADRRDATAQRHLRIVERLHGNLALTKRDHRRPGIALGAITEVNVTIDQAGKQRTAGRIDAVALEAGELAERRDSLDARALDQHAVILENNAGAIDHASAGIQCGHSGLSCKTFKRPRLSDPTAEEQAPSLTHLSHRPALGLGPGYRLASIHRGLATGPPIEPASVGGDEL